MNLAVECCMTVKDYGVLAIVVFIILLFFGDIFHDKSEDVPIDDNNF